MLHWSPDLGGHTIIARRLSFESASERLEMENASAHQFNPNQRIWSQPRSAPPGQPCFAPHSAAAPLGSVIANCRLNCQRDARAIYDRIATYIEEVRNSPRIDVSDAVYTRCMDELRSLREGRFQRVSQSLENLRALVDQLQSRLVLVEDSRLDSPDTFGEGRSEMPASVGRSDARPFPYAEQMRAFAHMAAQLNSTCRRVRQMERTPTAASPGAPPMGPGGTVPLNAYGSQDLESSGADTSRPARGDRTRM